MVPAPVVIGPGAQATPPRSTRRAIADLRGKSVMAMAPLLYFKRERTFSAVASGVIPNSS